MLELSRYSGRFVEAARQRLDAAFAHAARDDGAAELRMEVHALAGEAAMVQLASIAGAARQVEADALAWLERGDLAARVKAARGLRLLGRSIAELARSIAEQPAAGEVAARAVPGGAAAARSKVLVIDDSMITRDQIADGLTAAQLEVMAAGDLAAALAAVAAFKPFLALADVNMPGVTCEALCTQLRAAAGEPLRIMLMSGLAEPELGARARAVAAEFWVSKRGGVDVLVDRVIGVLRSIPGDAR